jgi:hypothetical protein
MFLYGGDASGELLLEGKRRDGYAELLYPKESKLADGNLPDMRHDLVLRIRCLKECGEEVRVVNSRVPWY